MQQYKTTGSIGNFEQNFLPAMSDPTSCFPIASDLSVSFGALLGGVFLGFMFYGANCLQL
jgi:hypothetical protein